MADLKHNAVHTQLHSPEPVEPIVLPLHLDEAQIIQAAQQVLQRRFARLSEPLTDFTKVSEFLILHLAPNEREVFAGLFLDTQLRPIAFEVLFAGTVNAVSVQPREVVKRALHYNARSVMVAHNHPSGSPTPSDDDYAMTQRIRTALDTVSITLIDHLLVTNQQVVSVIY